MAARLSKAALARLRGYRMKKRREAEGRFLVEGFHLLDEAMKAGRPILHLAHDAGRRHSASHAAILERAIGRAANVSEAGERDLAKLAETETCQGVVALVERGRWTEEAALDRARSGGPARLLALDAISDPGNCGSILRAADWYGMDAALLGAGCAELENGKTLRASMGAVFHLPCLAGEDLPARLAGLKEKGMTIVAAEVEGACSAAGFRWPERAVLAVGNESRGLGGELRRLADVRLAIPRFGAVESLNAAGATCSLLALWRLGSGAAGTGALE